MTKRFLHNLNLYREENDDFVPASMVLLNGTIEDYGALPVPADADELYDCGGGYLLPGLIDCHTHLSLDCTLKDYLARMNSSEEELTQIALDTMERDLKSGVTAQRCMGDRFYIDTRMKRKVAEGAVRGPRLFVSGIGMRSPKGFGYVGMPTEGEQIQETIDKNVEEGADWIKFYETATVPSNGVITAYYDENEIETILTLAHAAGKPVTSHCIGGEGLKAAVRHGIDCIEHAYFITVEELEMMCWAGTKFCMTAGEYFTDKENAPPEYQAKLRANRPAVRKSMERIMQSGIPFTLGTDGIHGRLWEEARYAVSFGASNAEAIRALTANAAALLGEEGSIGHIRRGYAADLLLVKGNPLENIENLAAVKQVFQAGKAVL